jgi:uncharacterized protein HemX
MFFLAQVVLPAVPTATSATGIDINQIAQLSGGNPVMVVALGAVALLGGKKVWDFFQKKQELAHEQKMEELKTMKTGHEACVAKQQALEEALQVLKNKLSELESKTNASEKKVEEVVATSEAKVEELKTKVSKLKKKVVEVTSEEKDKKKKT